MKHKGVAIPMLKNFSLFFFCMLLFGILTHSQISLYYAYMGLSLWYEKMIPSLLPFMLLSGMMIRLGLTESFINLLYPILNALFKVSRNVCYAIIIGFLCGFPMGAKTTADLLERHLIDQKEAEFLLSFCNNIGPIYFCSFVLPLLGRKMIFPYVIGMYGIPFLYGIILRHTVYKKNFCLPSFPENPSLQNQTIFSVGRFFAAMNDSIMSSMQSILNLCGYMVLFNLLNLIPHLLYGHTSIILAPVFEITGGLNLLRDTIPLYSLLILPFGGICCIAQTYSCISRTGLSIAKYTMHKLILTGLSALFYVGWYLLSPATFLG